MTQPNPFSMANSLEHLVNPKIVTGATGYQVQVDIANVDTYYGRQLGGPTATRQFTQAFIQQIGTTGLPTQQAFINQLGTSGSSGSAFFNTIGTTGSSGTAFFNQIGNSSSRGDGYFNTIYWNSFSPALPSGGSGGSGITFLNGPGISTSSGILGTTFSSLIQVGSGLIINNPGNGQPYIITNTVNPTFVQGSTGIRVVTSGNTYTLSSTVAVTGSQYIGVQQNGATFTISYLGSQGGGTGTITGVSGAYAVFNSSGNLSSSTVLTSTNVVGPTGSLMLYSPHGPTYSNLLTYLGGAFPRISTPFIDSKFSNGILSLVPFANENFIQSAGTVAQAFPLNISGAVGTPNITNFNIPTGLVTINPNNSYPSGVQNLGASSVSQNLFYGVSGATFNVYMWGGGGAGLSGYAGGAGGFVKVQNIFAGASGITFGFSIGGTGPGGNSLGLTVNTGSGALAAAIAPGGGAGGTGGVGAAFGEPGGSYPGQGFSSGGITGGTGGIYTNYETNGTTGFVYRLGVTGTTAQSGIFNNVQVTYGLTGIFPINTILYGYNANPTSIVNGQSGTTSTYFFPPGTTLVFQTTGITFNNSTYSLSGITFGVFDLSLPQSSLTGATFSKQASGGTYTVDTTLVNQQFQDGFIGGTFSGDGSGIHQILGGHTFSTGLTGLTFITSTNVSDVPTTGGIQITFNSDLTGIFSRSLGSVLAPQLRITDPIGISQNSIIQVQYRNTVTHGADGVLGATGVFGPTGSGYGFYTGGGGIQGGGGGAGSASFIGGFTGITGAGSGTSPYYDTYNLAGQYSFGGSGTQGGLPYYVIELVSPGIQPNVLQVNGNESVNGNLNVNGNISAYQPNTGGIQALLVHNNFDVSNRKSVSVFLDQAQGPSISFDNNSTTLSGPVTQNALLSYTRDTSGGYFNMNRPLNVQAGITATASTFTGLLTAQAGITATASTFTGQIDGTTGVFSGSVTATDFTITSDRRLKENIQTVDSALDKIMKMRGVYFTRIGSERRNLGVIAQEVEEIIPEVVFTDESPEQMKSVAYGNIIGLLIEAVKEQQLQIDELIHNTKVLE